MAALADAMNYRHAFHAGNFADVLKHIILARVIVYMTRKPQPFRVIDTHAGAGRYDLAGVEAVKTGEWKDGIARLLSEPLTADAEDLLQPYVSAITALNQGVVGDAPHFYPGSPRVARHLMRDIDHLVVNELHADDEALLRREFAHDRSTTVLGLDAWTAIKALLPPKERRGVILIDPPFEDRREFTALTTAIEEAIKRFETGTMIVWYPIKDAVRANDFIATITARPGLKFTDARLAIATPFAGLGLTETGVLILNPPYTLHAELTIILPALVAALGLDRGAKFELRSSGV